MNEYKFSDLNIGHKESFSVTITDDMRDSFRELTGDINPLHNDQGYAETKGHDRCVAFGMMTASFLSTLAGVYLPGKYSLIHKTEVTFRKPVYIGDTITVTGEITEMNDTFNIIYVKVTITNQDNVKVVKGSMEIGIEE